MRAALKPILRVVRIALALAMVFCWIFLPAIDERYLPRPWRDVVLIAGALGALARYGLGGYIANRYPSVFPWETLVINVTGSFVLGLLFVIFTERLMPHAALRTALMVGFVGAYTTFSTFSLETFRLIEDGAIGLALINIGASVGAGLLAVYLGVVIGRAV